MRSVLSYEKEIEELQAQCEVLEIEKEELRELLSAYHTNVAIGKQLEHADPLGMAEWEQTMDDLQKRAEQVLFLDQESVDPVDEAEEEIQPYGTI